jgi:hypothetical protein
MQLGPIPWTNPSNLEGFERGLSGGERERGQRIADLVERRKNGAVG